MKYRKKPVVIEAFQYDGDLKGSDGKYYVPEWAVKAFEDEVMYFDSLKENETPCELFIKTLEGDHHVSVGDYVIQGVNGELYPCKPDIFEKTYDAAEEGEKTKLTIGMYFEIKLAEDDYLYSATNLDLDTENMTGFDLQKFKDANIKNYSELCKVPEENVRVISRKEYQENTEED